ncbi:hypothetical protein CYMTET_17166, partial [Cymbomonas tetramitiformis]
YNTGSHGAVIIGPPSLLDFHQYTEVGFCLDFFACDDETQRLVANYTEFDEIIPIITDLMEEHHRYATIQQWTYYINSVINSIGAVFTECLFSENKGTSGGALYADVGRILFRNCTFVNNTAESAGGAVYISSLTPSIHPNSVHCLIINCSFEHNVAVVGGAFNSINSGSLDIRDCKFVGNNATGLNSNGGAVSIEYIESNLYDSQVGSEPVVLISETLFHGNTASADTMATYSDIQPELQGGGGGLSIINRFTPTLRASLSDVHCKGNTALLGGGALFGGDTQIRLQSSEFTENTASNGGGIAVHDTVRTRMAFILIDRNRAVDTASSSGGGLFLMGYSVAICEQCDISYNMATMGAGVALTHFSTLQFISSRLFENEALTGGGMHAASTVKIYLTDSQIALNRAFTSHPDIIGGAALPPDDVLQPGGGGGYALFESPKVQLVDVTIAQNSAQSNGGGTLLFIIEPELFDNVVMEENSAIEGGGAIYYNAQVYSNLTQSACYASKTLTDNVAKYGFDVASQGMELVTSVQGILPIDSGQNIPSFLVYLLDQLGAQVPSDGDYAMSVTMDYADGSVECRNLQPTDDMCVGYLSGETYKVASGEETAFSDFRVFANPGTNRSFTVTLELISTAVGFEAYTSDGVAVTNVASFQVLVNVCTLGEVSEVSIYGVITCVRCSAVENMFSFNTANDTCDRCDSTKSACVDPDCLTEECLSEYRNEQTTATVIVPNVRSSCAHVAPTY